MNTAQSTATRLAALASLRLLVLSLALAATGCYTTTYGPEPGADVNPVDDTDAQSDTAADVADALVDVDTAGPDLADGTDTEILDVAPTDLADTATEVEDAQTEIDTAPTGFPLGHACTDNLECTSELCLKALGADGFCSETCEGSCPAGLRCSILPGSGSTTIHYCAPLPGDLCKPCKVDEDCKGGTCLTLEGTGESLCGVTCGGEAGEACPVGFVCQSFSKGEQCVPASGTCSCTPDRVDATWACALQTSLGKCQGVQTCSETGWSTCSAKLPTAELCDGQDNDCNGQTDETFAALGSPCGVGVCAGGTLVCAADNKKLACSTDGKKLKKDTCGDGQDNDCNGQTDEGCPPKDVDGDGVPDLADCSPYQPQIHPNAPEGCCLALAASTGGQPVPVTALTLACDLNCDGMVTPCGAYDKDGDGFALPEDCSDTDAAIHPGAPEKCGDGVDQDCNGGDIACDSALDQDSDGYMVPSDCDDSTPLIHPGAKEICNGIDDDCDGAEDDGNPGGGSSCGNNAGACTPGTMVCSHLTLVAQVVCIDAKGGEPEVCNGFDDDCDGKTDEDFEDLGKACDSDDADACKLGKYICSADGLGVACPTETTTDVAELCKMPGTGNDKDDDCDGLTDEICYGDDPDGDGVIGPADCNPLDAGFHPGATEGCCDPALGDSKAALAACDRDCDGQVTPCDLKDTEQDGHVGEEDCAEGDPLSYSGAPEKCGDSIDQDCDGKDLDCAEIVGADDDADGFPAGVDCKPFDKNIHPNAPELCNNKDDDCDGITDEGNPEALPGACGSSQGLCQPGQQACVHVGFKAMVVCAPKVGPVPELCNGLDDNCNGKTDEYFIQLGQGCDGPDEDVCKKGVFTCSTDGKGVVCSNETETNIAELCDGSDNDCDGQTDEGMTYFGKTLGADCKGLGVCGAGKVVCSPELQVAVCSTDGYGTQPQAQAETCDGKDNDCDGYTDEGMTFLGQPLGAQCYGNGECGKVAGKVECGQAGAAICSTMLGGTKYQGKPEVCDAIDNNCDGHIDEGLDVTDSSCKKTGICSTSNVTASCKAGKWLCNYDAVAGFQGDAEVFCDGIDNDCDGKTDDEFSVGLACDTPDSDLCPLGKVVCSADKLFSLCGPETQTDITETCNGKDDDCDNKTDEDFPVGQQCDGPDADLCKGGLWVCAKDGSQATCEGDDLEKGEQCDGVDNDCNGLTDETFPTLGQPCDGSDADQCKNGVFGCAADGKGTTCASEIVVDTAEKCDGKDNDCDGQTDEGQIYEGGAMGASCKGIGACGTGKVVCSPITFKATCSTNPDAYLIFDGKELCDGLDNDCNGMTDDALAWKGKSLGQACDGVGECGAGKVECGGDKQVTCSTLKNGTASQSKAEVCDGKDNDCDGLTDNGLTLSDAPCLKAGVCATGKVTATCQANGQWKCDYSAISGWQGAETLCDGIDNDCNGETDEGFDIGVTCDGPDNDSCKTGKWSCSQQDPTMRVCEEAMDIPEVCDGKDNDCDGKTDEDFTYSGTKLLGQCKGYGICGLGTVVCSKDNLIATCSTNPDGGASQAKVEECDSLDNDCNGKTDDTLKYSGLPVGAPCSGIGECGLGTVVCVAKKAVCSVNPDGSNSQAKPELCDGKDNDCNAQTDESLDPKKSTCNMKGVCQAALTAVCLAGNWKCSYAGAGYEAKETLCDNLDNNCDGVTDDPYPSRGQPCDGPDVDQCKNGAFECAANKMALVCGVETGAASDEICDGKDNDCNGLTDEPYPQLGQACDGTDEDLCSFGVWSCTLDGKNVTCPPESVPNQVEVCDGQDNDCDGQTDEGFGVGATCDGPDDDKCSNGTTVCAGPAKTECQETKSFTELCNQKDDDCDGQTDEGFSPGTKCDGADGDSCATGIYKCTDQGAQVCIGDAGCVGGALCKPGGSNGADQCLCGNVNLCTLVIGSTCAGDGKCTCYGGPTCTGGQTCVKDVGCK